MFRHLSLALLDSNRENVPNATVRQETQRISTFCFLWLSLLASSLAASGQQTSSTYIRSSQPALLNYSELVTLSEDQTVSSALAEKLNKLLTTPFISNEAYYRSAKPIRPDLKGMGPSLRLVTWNIERGLELDELKLVLTDKSGFLAKVHTASGTADKTQGLVEQLREQIDVLQSADVFVLNEVDWGMKRTDYKAVVKELADALNMNWAYGVEFVEVDPKVLGREPFAGVKDESKRKELENLFSVDEGRVLGLHGSAILSRYPIRDVKLVPFKYQAYDWYHGEKKYGKLESGKRKGSRLVFGEEILREVRRGGRTNLVATLDVPELPDQQVTIIATHLENRTAPKGRRKQLGELLDLIHSIPNPVIVGGDINTTGVDGSVTNVKALAQAKATDPAFWTTKGVKYATGVGIGMDVVSFAFKQTKFQSDPTASGVPLMAANPEQGLFKDLDSFRFDDGGRFDFRGDPEFSLTGRGGTLGNSNERGSKGFVTTYALPRTLGVKGKYKLDWIFVKAFLKPGGNPPDSYWFAPHFARTMNEVNEALEEPLSDHAPISVDLPLTPPGRPGSRSRK